MDIWLVETDKGTLLRPSTIHGMLWLQTHFSTEAWEALASDQVTIPDKDAKRLSIDAREAGLSLNCLSTLSIATNF